MVYGYAGAELNYFKAKVFYMLMSEPGISIEPPLVNEVFDMVSGNFSIDEAAKIIKEYENKE